MTQDEFERAQEISAELQGLQAERAAWASVGIDQGGGTVNLQYMIGKRSMPVPTNTTLTLRTNMLRHIDAQITALRNEFSAL